MELLIKWSIAPLVAATILSLLRFHRLSRTMRYLAVLLWWMMATEVVSRLLWYHHLPNLFLRPLYNTGECILLVLLYAQALKAPKTRNVLYALGGLLCLYSLLDTLTFGKGVSFRPLQEAGRILLILLLVSLYFKKLLDELRILRLELDPMFLTSLGLLIYALGTSLILLFSNYMLHHASKSFNTTIWTIHALLLSFLTSCYGLAIFLHNRYGNTYEAIVRGKRPAAINN